MRVKCPEGGLNQGSFNGFSSFSLSNSPPNIVVTLAFVLKSQPSIYGRMPRGRQYSVHCRQMRFILLVVASTLTLQCLILQSTVLTSLSKRTCWKVSTLATHSKMGAETICWRVWVNHYRYEKKTPWVVSIWTRWNATQAVYFAGDVLCYEGWRAILPLPNG